MMVINRTTRTQGRTEIALRTTRDGRPKFYLCGGCDHWHPFGWGGDCRNDAHRFTVEQLDTLFPDTNKDGWPDWYEADEKTGR
jgi:hypothetical protein